MVVFNDVFCEDCGEQLTDESGITVHGAAIVGDSPLCLDCRDEWYSTHERT